MLRAAQRGSDPGKFFSNLRGGCLRLADHLLYVVPMSDHAQPGVQGREGLVSDRNISCNQGCP